MIPSFFFFFEELAGPEPGHKPNTPPLDHLLLTITNEVDGTVGRQIPFWPRHPWYTPIGSFHHEKNEKTDGGRRASCVRTYGLYETCTYYPHTPGCDISGTVYRCSTAATSPQPTKPT